MLTLFIPIKVFSEWKSNEVVIKNKWPKYGKLKLEIVEEDLIRESDIDENYMYKYVRDIAVDSNNNIYLLDSHLKNIFKYDYNGKFIHAVGNFGQGPGEYMSPRGIFVDDRNNLYVNDNGRAIIKFSSNGLFKSRIKLCLHMTSNNFFVDDNGNIYGFFREISDTEIRKVFIKLDQKGQALKRIKEYVETNLNVKRVGSGAIIGGLSHEYSADIFFSSILNKQHCIGENLKYELEVYDLQGKLVLSYDKAENPQSISGDIARLKRLIGKDYVNSMNFPPHKPFFKDLLCDEKGRIYVVRVKSYFDRNKNEIVDIFNKNGQYLYKTTFPYFPRCIKNGYIIAIDRDEEDRVIIKKLIIKNYDQILY